MKSKSKEISDIVSDISDVPAKRVPKPVISFKNLSRKAPYNQTLFAILIIKEFRLYSSIVGAIFIGMIGLIILFFWTLYIVDLIKYDEKPIDIFNNQMPK